MRRATTCPCLCAGLALLFAGSSARAELIEWRFSTAVSPTLVGSNNHRFGWVHITATGGVAFGSTHLVLANLFSVSGAPAQAPDVYHHRPFNVTLAITDKASNKSGKAIFTGVIDGTTSLFTSLLTFRLTSPAHQRLHLGHHIYDIRLDSITPPGAWARPFWSVTTRSRPQWSWRESARRLSALLPGSGAVVPGAANRLRKLPGARNSHRATGHLHPRHHRPPDQRVRGHYCRGQQRPAQILSASFFVAHRLDTLGRRGQKRLLGNAGAEDGPAPTRGRPCSRCRSVAARNESGPAASRQPSAVSTQLPYSRPLVATGPRTRRTPKASSGKDSLHGPCAPASPPHGAAPPLPDAALGSALRSRRCPIPAGSVQRQDQPWSQQVTDISPLQERPLERSRRVRRSFTQDWL
jgi:hypothetical protein